MCECVCENVCVSQRSVINHFVGEHPTSPQGQTWITLFLCFATNPSLKGLDEVKETQKSVTHVDPFLVICGYVSAKLRTVNNRALFHDLSSVSMCVSILKCGVSITKWLKKLSLKDCKGSGYACLLVCLDTDCCKIQTSDCLNQTLPQPDFPPSACWDGAQTLRIMKWSKWGRKQIKGKKTSFTATLNQHCFLLCLWVQTSTLMGQKESDTPRERRQGAGTCGNTYWESC